MAGYTEVVICLCRVDMHMTDGV